MLGENILTSNNKTITHITLKTLPTNNGQSEVKGTHLTFLAFPASNWPCPTFTFLKPGEVWHLPLFKHSTPFRMQQLSKIYMPHTNQCRKLASLECKCSDSKVPATCHSLYLLFEQTWVESMKARRKHAGVMRDCIFSSMLFIYYFSYSHDL